MKQLSKALRDFSKKQELLRLAYSDADGYPRVVPVWFVIVRGKYCVGTGTSSPKWNAIKRDPRVGWVIDGGKKQHYKGISERGRAVEITDRRFRSDVYRTLCVKYFGRAHHKKFVEIYGEVDDPETLFFTLEPDGGFSWDY